MKLSIQAVNFDIANRLSEHIEKKTKRFSKFLPESAEMEVKMTLVKPETNLNKEAQISVRGVGSELFAKKVCDTFEQSVDDTLEAIERQLERIKTNK